MYRCGVIKRDNFSEPKSIRDNSSSFMLQNYLFPAALRRALGNRIKWALAEAGYPSDFVETLTFELVTVVTLVSRERKRAAS